MSTRRTIAGLAPQVRRGEVSPVALVEECLAKIKTGNKSLNAFITVLDAEARREALVAETEIRNGRWRGPLHGIPIAIKDLIDAAGIRTTAGSELYEHHVAGADATVVRKLREAGAILIGKNNLHEFAYGGSSLVSYFGEVRNPWNAEFAAGGSSGGSAAAVAAGMAYAAIGTDTAGSIREPAALCGCVGLKPTYGRVSTRGVIALSPSLDHAGPITASTEDAAIVLRAIAGYDASDLRSAEMQVPDFVSVLKEDAKTIRVGVAREFFFDGLDAEVTTAMEHALRGIEILVKSVKDIKLEVPTDRSLQAAESWAEHAENVAKSPEKYQPETLRRIRTGENVSAAEYTRRQKEMERARREIGKVFGDVDVIITPTAPIPAPRVAELKANAEKLRPTELMLLRNTRPFNVWGLPAISIPCGFSQSGLPIGLQIGGPDWREDLVLRTAHAYEQATAWHKRCPLP